MHDLARLARWQMWKKRFHCTDKPSHYDRRLILIVQCPLDSLASSLDTKFRYTGQLEDLDEAISLYREALELKPIPHPERWTFLNNLGNSLPRRFDQTGHFVDIEEAISLHREAVGCFPPIIPIDQPHLITSPVLLKHS